MDRDEHKINIDQKYADDISFLRSYESKINQVERIIPTMLKEEGLMINKNKTEKYCVFRTGDESWKICKYLASFINTAENMKHCNSNILKIFWNIDFEYLQDTYKASSSTTRNYGQ